MPSPGPVQKLSGKSWLSSFGLPHVFFPAIVIVLPISCFEAVTFISSLAKVNLYSHEADVLSRLRGQEKAYSRFLENRYDAVTGWRNPRSYSRESYDCLGALKTYSYDALGVRRETGSEQNPDMVRVLAVGDSFTHGDDVADDETFPAQLGKIMGVAVANHGVEGFGPLQSVLRFEHMFSAYPNARIALFGVMYEDIRRLPNSYRPVYTSEGNIFGFKPYITFGQEDLQLVKNPNGPNPVPFDGLEVLTKEAFLEDYYAKPNARFPYSLSTIRGLGSNWIHMQVTGNLGRLLGFPKFYFDYRDEKLLSGLSGVIKRFVKAAEIRDMLSVVAFIPQSGNDTTSPDPFIADMEAELGERALFVNVGHSEIDWSIYNLARGCHPSPQGNAAIATAVSDALEMRGWWPEATLSQAP